MRSMPVQVAIFFTVVLVVGSLIGFFALSVGFLGDQPGVGVVTTVKIGLSLLALLTMVTVLGISLVWLER